MNITTGLDKATSVNPQHKLLWNEITKKRETAAWLPIKDTLLHIVSAEDSWIHHSIKGLDDPRRPFPFEKYKRWSDIIDYNKEVVAKTDKYLGGISESELDRKVTRVTTRTRYGDYNCGKG